MELTTLIALCRSDTAENVVQVIDHGWLSRHTDMYYDMELCDANLYNYLSADWDEDQKKKMPWFTDVNELGKLARGLQIWNIMIDISAGINFIHSKRFIHRDIKPRNGIMASWPITLILSSVVFVSWQMLENCRLWTDCAWIG